MTKLVFSKEQVRLLNLEAGLRILGPDYGFTFAFEGKDGIAVHLRNMPGDVTETRIEQGKAELGFDFSRRILFFRGLSVLLQALSEGKDEFAITESACFDTFGPMLDLSQGNMVLHVKAMKQLLRRSSMMGLNMCMLYMEDNFVVPEEPYFGHMRSKYTYAEMKELDDYADALGIELIPAIQTLAHQSTVVVWDAFLPIRENHRTLLPGEEKTYEFLRHVLAAATKPFRSKRVHIGMDECNHLGHGAHFLHHGLVPEGEILLKHLARVCEICKELDIRPMVWDDRFFLALAEQRGNDNSDLSYLDSIPEDLDMVYYGYGTSSVEKFERQIETHRKGDSGGIFCNSIWTWLGFGPNWERTIVNHRSTVTACRNKKIREMILSVWEVGFDCEFRTNYFGMQTFAEFCYRVEPTEDDFRRRFRFCTGGDYDDFWLLHEFDCVPSVPDHNIGKRPSTATEFLLWQDPMCGLFDYDIEGLALNAHFEKLEKAMHPCIENARGTDFEHVFEFYRCLADVLALKSELGNQLRSAYLANDRDTLAKLADEVIPETYRRAAALKEQHRICWRQCGKALGWEIYDLHYGGTLARLDSAARAVRDYLEGRLDQLEELAEERRSYKRGGMGFASPKIPSWTDKWGRIVSGSIVTPEFWLHLPQAPYIPEDVNG